MHMQFFTTSPHMKIFNKPNLRFMFLCVLFVSRGIFFIYLCVCVCVWGGGGGGGKGGVKR